MVKSDIYYDMNFRAKCSSYGLNWQKFNVWDNVIIIETPKKGMYVLMDEHYNIIDITKLYTSESKKTVAEYKSEYTNVVREKGHVFKKPFEDFSISQIINLADRISIVLSNQGNSTYMLVNGEYVTDNKNNIYTLLLYYIKFLGEQIKEYYMKLYQMKIMGFDYPDIYTYMNRIIEKIEELASDEKDNYPFPTNIVKYLGQVDKVDAKYQHMLYKIVRLLDREKDREFENISVLANNLKILLEITDEEVKRRYEEAKETHNYNEININSFLFKRKKKQYIKKA